MKNIKVILLMPILLASCKTKETSYEKWIFVSPTGAPAIALSYFSGFQNFQTNGDATNIVAMMKAGKADVVVLPTNAGIQAIRQGCLQYKMVATLTHGNIYIASTGNDDNGEMDSDDYIVSFQKGAVPDKIFHYVYGEEYDNALHYVSNVQEAAKCLKSGKNLADEGNAVDYVVLAEPALTNVLNTTPKASQYADLQELYKVKSNGKDIFQAALFVKDSLDLKKLNEFVLSKLENSINQMNKSSDFVVNLMNQNSNPEATFGVKPEIAKAMFDNGNRMNIDYKLISKNKDGVNLFLSLFGIDQLNDEEIFK